MYFHCHTAERDGWTVVAVVGELDLAALPGVRAEVVGAVSRRAVPRLVLDLSGVELVDSVGLGLVVGALKRVRSAGGELRVVAPSERVRSVFRLTGLDTLFPIVATFEAAVGEGAAAVPDHG